MISIIKKIKEFLFTHIENIIQTRFLVAIFRLSVFVPRNSQRNVIENTFLIVQQDGLLAIQQILYSENIYFLIIPVFILLIALIGAAVFVKTSSK